MNFSICKRKNKLIKTLISVFLAVGIIIGACALYVGDYYHADEDSIAAFKPINVVKMNDRGGGILTFEPENPVAGFIFYPGGKVEYTAYKPLMAALAERGILCVLIEMPWNLAVLDVNAADGVQEQYPQIRQWYIGGHSLGGSMAASYISGHKDEYCGLVLLGAYSTENLSESGLSVLSVWGSEDGVMNREKYESNKSNLPNDFTEVVIEGGCHAFFGMYGAQKGDGTPSVSNEEQIYVTAEAIKNMIN